jgi:hypothetical protein
MKITLYWAWDNGEDKHLVLDPKYYDNQELALIEDVFLEQIADLLDQDAESENSHQLVGVHRGLAFLLHQNCGREIATRIFWDLATFGGLHNIRDNLGDLNIPNCWQPWRLE